MRKTLVVSVMFSLASPGIASAQEVPEIALGDRIRVTAPECGLLKEKVSFRGTSGDLLTFRYERDERTCPWAAVDRLEVYRGKRRWSRGATIGAMTGAAVWSGYSLVSAKPLAESWLPWTPMFMAIGAGWGLGRSSRKWALYGLGGAAVGGLAVGMSCEGMGCIAVILPVGVGLIVPPIVGLIRGEEHWERIGTPAVRPVLALDGNRRISIGASVRLRR